MQRPGTQELGQALGGEPSRLSGTGAHRPASRGPEEPCSGLGEAGAGQTPSASLGELHVCRCPGAEAVCRGLSSVTPTSEGGDSTGCPWHSRILACGRCQPEGPLLVGGTDPGWQLWAGGRSRRATTGLGSLGPAPRCLPAGRTVGGWTLSDHGHLPVRQHRADRPPSHLPASHPLPPDKGEQSSS